MQTYTCVIYMHLCACVYTHVIMTHSYVCNDSFIRVTCLIYMCDITNSYVRHDSFICV